MKPIARICLAIFFLGTSLAFSHPVLAQALATGDFSCNVITIEPPNGPGTPQGFASVSFNQALGLVGGSVSTFQDLGSPSGLDAVCQQLADAMLVEAQGERCATGPLAIVENVGGNFMEKIWRFSILCNANEVQVVGSVGNILEALLTTPLVSGQISQRQTNEMRDGSSLSFGPIHNGPSRE